MRRTMLQSTRPPRIWRTAPVAALSVLTRMFVPPAIGAGTPRSSSAGSRIVPSKLTEAEVMADVLRDEFRVPVRWVVGEGRDTLESAAADPNEFVRSAVANAIGLFGGGD